MARSKCSDRDKLVWLVLIGPCDLPALTFRGSCSVICSISRLYEPNRYGKTQSDRLLPGLPHEEMRGIIL